MPTIETEVTFTGYVDVDVDLSKFDTEDLAEELRTRPRMASFNINYLSRDDINSLIERFRVALYFGDNDKTVEAAAIYFEKVHGLLGKV